MITSQVHNDITYPFPNANGAATEFLKIDW